MTTALIVLALAAAGFGILSMSQATMGAALVGVGCLFAIFARLAQASAQHAALMGQLARIAQNHQEPLE